MERRKIESGKASGHMIKGKKERGEKGGRDREKRRTRGGGRRGRGNKCTGDRVRFKMLPLASRQPPTFNWLLLRFTEPEVIKFPFTETAVF